MKRKRGFFAAWLLLLCAAGLLTGCGLTTSEPETEVRLRLVATTTMLTDLCGSIGGERVRTEGLMGPGIDPHLYKASAGDVKLIAQADVVVYHGLHLEGRMGEVLEQLNDAAVICIGDAIEETALLYGTSGTEAPDPHIWFEVALWKEAARTLANGLSAADPEGASYYAETLAAYEEALDEAEEYLRMQAETIAAERRVLVTAHDAFGYFGRAYGFAVYGLQGISTDAQAGTADVSALAALIVEKRIPAIFVETSISSKTIEALQEAVCAQGFQVEIGGTLYSDSLGDGDSGADTYLNMVRANIDTIVEALK